jgi:hypothetical protein
MSRAARSGKIAAWQSAMARRSTEMTAMTAMRRMAQVIGLAAAIAGLACGLLGGSAKAGGAQWIGPYSDGCWYYGDGATAWWAACPRSDGMVGVVAAQNGQWVLVAIVGYESHGCLAAWMNGQETIYACPTLVGSTYWGDYTITNWTPGPGYTTIGGDGLPAESFHAALTGNALIDAINVASNYQDVSLWLQPRCVMVDSSTCVIES